MGEKYESSRYISFTLLVMFLGLGAFAIGLSIGYHLGDKNGQIDALNGSIKYEKKLRVDSVYYWIEIKEPIKKSNEFVDDSSNMKWGE